MLFLLKKKFFLQLKTHHFYHKFRNHIKLYGITKDPESNDYMLVMKHASGGNLHQYLQEKFTTITWNKEKLSILLQISEGYIYIC